ncbi:PIN domain-containing protein [Bacillus infantis]|uniref:PIN domain-containing protein n=1 Tax=Bacillus infantis TaxID=324767 RepID=UPI00209FB9D7|nr:PIN domain-containing protein [Bacillus infantis]MCP1159449.1 PIN domain-containing protein [Bacillus infantis]
MKDIVVLDTNIFINAIFDRANYPNDFNLLKLESQGIFQLAFSKYTADELFKIMSRHINDENVFECSDFFITLSRVIERSIIRDHPATNTPITNRSDQNFVDLAIDVKAAYLITNDLESGILQRKNLNGVTFFTPFQYVHNYYRNTSKVNNTP